MSKTDVIEKALLLNNVCEDDIVVVKTDTTTTFLLHLLRMLVLLLYNFALGNKMSEEELCDFVMQNFNEILDTVITELHITLLQFSNLYEEELAKEIELDNKNECFLVVAIQDKFNAKLKNIKERS